jgi:predicted transcriptional regulator of viral defense system
MKRALYRELVSRAADQHGLLTPADATALGIDATQLRILAHRGVLEHVARGVYRVPELPTTALTPLLQAVLWVGHDAVVSHESTLVAYGLGDFNPSRVHLTVPASYRLRREAPRWLQLWRADIPPAERSTIEGVPVTTPERALREVIETGSDPAMVRQAIARARREGLLSPAAARRLTDRSRRRSNRPADRLAVSA